MTKVFRKILERIQKVIKTKRYYIDRNLVDKTVISVAEVVR